MRLQGQGGFTYLGILFAVVLMGLVLAGTGEVWYMGQRRDKEVQLMFVGSQFSQAIRSYYDRSPGAKEYPRRLEDLIRDNRFPFVVRHLRRLYLDPVTNSPDWGLVKAGDRIVGVYSQAPGQPLKQHGFPIAYQHFEGQESYKGWVFSALDSQPSAQPR